MREFFKKFLSFLWRNKKTIAITFLFILLFVLFVYAGMLLAKVLTFIIALLATFFGFGSQEKIHKKYEKELKREIKKEEKEEELIEKIYKEKNKKIDERYREEKKEKKSVKKLLEELDEE